MKLRYVFGAILSAILFVGCSNEDSIESYGNLSDDNTFIIIPEEGGDVAVTLNADAPWAFDNIFELEVTIDGQKVKKYFPLPVKLNADKTDGEYTWLTVDKLSGDAGANTIVFHANATNGGHQAELRLSIGGKKQFIRVSQGVNDESVITVADALNLIKTGKIPESPIIIKGTVCKINEISTSYGNATYFLSDDGSFQADNWVEIYRGYWISGEKFTTGEEFSVGDVLTVKGVLVNYGGNTPELTTGSEVIAIEKSLLSVESVDIEGGVLPMGGGDFTVTLLNKGDGLNVKIPDEAKSWLFVTGINISGEKTIVSFRAAANDANSRTATVGFSTTSEGKEYSSEAAIAQKGSAFPATGDGTAENPYNVTAALDKAVAGASDVFIRGIVCQAPTSFNESYGNLGYYISASGKEEDMLQVYRGFSFNGDHFTSKDDIQLGDVVVIKGNLKLYNGQAEVDQNNQLFNLNTLTSMEGVNDPGSYRKPFDIASVISYIDAAGTGNVFVKGIVSKVESPFSTDYGNGTFWISDDGTKYDDPLKDFEAYRVLWLGNKNWAEGDDQIAVGDKVVLCGQVTKYNTTYETSSKKAYVFSVNGLAR